MEKKKKTGNNKKAVKVVVKPVYVGRQNMTKVFSDIAVDNIRRKMKA